MEKDLNKKIDDIFLKFASVEENNIKKNKNGGNTDKINHLSNLDNKKYYIELEDNINTEILYKEIDKIYRQILL